MRLPAWSSGKSGRKPFAVNARHKQVLKRVQKDLKQILEWKESFPMLVEPGASETLFFKTRDFEAALGVALDTLPTNHVAGFTAANAQALAASETIREIKRKTGRSHYASVVVLFDAVLSAEGRTDLFNSEEKLKKIVKRYSRKNSK
jgi:hypothetical protein